jgi:hypothetical protein
MKPDFDTISFCNLVGMNKTQFIQRIEEVKAEKILFEAYYDLYQGFGKRGYCQNSGAYF